MDIPILYLFTHKGQECDPIFSQMGLEVGIYKRKQESKKERKHILDQESKIQQTNDYDQEKEEGNGKRKLELYI